MAKKPKDPAGKPALAPAFDMVDVNEQAKTGDFIPSNEEMLALAPASRRGDEMVFVRRDGIEMTYVDGKWLMRDVDLGRLISLSRPRYIRERIKAMIKEKGQVKPGQIISVITDDANVYYVDSELATTLAFRSNSGSAETIAGRMFKVNALYSGSEHQESISAEKALTAYERSVVAWDRAKTKSARDALLPIVQRRARNAGFEPPAIDSTELNPKDHPRLPGV